MGAGLPNQRWAEPAADQSLCFLLQGQWTSYFRTEPGQTRSSLCCFVRSATSFAFWSFHLLKWSQLKADQASTCFPVCRNAEWSQKMLFTEYASPEMKACLGKNWLEKNRPAYSLDGKSRISWCGSLDCLRVINQIVVRSKMEVRKMQQLCERSQSRRDRHTSK